MTTTVCDTPTIQNKSKQQSVERNNVDPIRHLVDVCRTTFANVDTTDPRNISQELLAPIHNALQNITNFDVGLQEPLAWVPEKYQKYVHLSTPPDSFRSSKSWNLLEGRKPATYYYDIVEDQKFSICVFIIPPGGTVPLHDHKHMAVLSKVLYGSLRVSSYDWVVSDLSNSSLGGLARLHDCNSLLQKNDIKILYPNSGGNLHTFSHSLNDSEAVQTTLGSHLLGSAILDVILPPYDDGDRPCTYFQVSDAAIDDQTNLLHVLHPIPQPSSFRIYNIL